jgi:hypothetical protein
LKKSLTITKLCEACERNAAEHIEPCDDPGESYIVCSVCLQRLQKRALRPLEWFNLAKRHGWSQYLLHDDFYDDDGTACQPEGQVDRPEDFPAPTLAEVSRDARTLVDYSITRWHFDGDVVKSWEAIGRPEILTVLAERFSATPNFEVRCRLLEICASSLGETGIDFVRYAWGEYPLSVALWPLVMASAACLPFREGFDRVATVLESAEGAMKRDLMSSLGHFHSPEVLDWIERHIFEPITDAWGHLAAASRLDWGRVERWLEGGRPLSLVAIDALGAIARPQSPFLRAYGPRLHQPPGLDSFRQVLLAYARRDPEPRVEQRISKLISCAETLTKES